MIKKKYPRQEPKQHGSNNIYVDAALEALKQASEEDERFSYLIVVHDTPKGLCGVEMRGDVCGMASTLAHFAKQDRLLDTLIMLAGVGNKARKDFMDFEDFLDKSEKRMDDYLEELRRNRPKE